MSIKRYEPVEDGIHPYNTGDYVLIRDHIAALEAVRKSAAILLAHAEHGIDGPMPGWLVDCRRDIEAATLVPSPALEANPDLQEQIDACPDCQRFKPVVCVTHRRAQVALEAVKATVSRDEIIEALIDGAVEWKSNVTPGNREQTQADHILALLSRTASPAIVPSPALEANQQVIETLRAAVEAAYHEGWSDRISYRATDPEASADDGWTFSEARAALTPPTQEEVK